MLCFIEIFLSGLFIKWWRNRNIKTEDQRMAEAVRRNAERMRVLTDRFGY